MKNITKFLAQYRSELVEVLGVLIVAFGIAMIYVPAGVIVLGLALVLIGMGLDPRPLGFRRDAE